jgi:hypothetical protein
MESKITPVPTQLPPLATTVPPSNTMLSKSMISAASAFALIPTTHISAVAAMSELLKYFFM